jgi:hypothetical protein
MSEDNEELGCDDSEEHQRLEVTIGVMVPFVRQADGTYKLMADELVTTTGGLFSDAEEGPWCEACQEWVDGPGAIMSRADHVVGRLLGSVAALMTSLEAGDG